MAIATEILGGTVDFQVWVFPVPKKEEFGPGWNIFSLTLKWQQVLLFGNGSSRPFLFCCMARAVKVNMPSSVKQNRE